MWTLVAVAFETVWYYLSDDVDQLKDFGIGVEVFVPALLHHVLVAAAPDQSLKEAFVLFRTFVERGETFVSARKFVGEVVQTTVYVPCQADLDDTVLLILGKIDGTVAISIPFVEEAAQLRHQDGPGRVGGEVAEKVVDMAGIGRGCMVQEVQREPTLVGERIGTEEVGRNPTVGSTLDRDDFLPVDRVVETGNEGVP